MSVPRTLDLPEGVEASRISTPRGGFAAHLVRVPEAHGHVLLVPGWTGSKEDFTPLLPLLASAGFDATAYDQRGQFETPGTATDDYSLPALAADATAVAAACDSRPSHLLGHSFGGLVAQRATIDHRGAWRSLSLLCSGPGALGDSQRRPLRRLVAALGKVPLLQIHQLREQGVRRPAQIAAFLARRFTSNSPAALRAMTQHLIDAPDVIDEIAALNLPVWVGRGAGDDAWAHDLQESMAIRLGGRVHVVTDSAHSPAIENPSELAALLVPFWQKAT